MSSYYTTEIVDNSDRGYVFTFTENNLCASDDWLFMDFTSAIIYVEEHIQDNIDEFEFPLTYTLIRNTKGVSTVIARNKLDVYKRIKRI